VVDEHPQTEPTCCTDRMIVLLGFVALAAVMTAVVWWPRRHGNPGVDGHDPQGHRDIGAHGGPPMSGHGSSAPGGGGGPS
jgi:hypothetical protein